MAIIDVSQDILSGIDKEQARTYWDTIDITSTSNTISAGTQSDIWTASASKTTTNSNLSTNGMLPIQFSAVIYRFRLSAPEQSLLAGDLKEIAQGAYFEFYRNQNELVYQVPLADLAAGQAVTGVSPASAATAGYNFGVDNLAQIPALPEFGQIAIAAGMGFRGSVTWSDQVDLASGTDSFKLRFLFDCKLMKPVS